MDELITLVARAGIVGAGLIGGTLFAFSTFIMRALRRMPDAEGVRAMQAINRTVYTPWFMGPFFGTTLLSVLCIIVAGLHRDRAWWPALAGAGTLFVVGVFGITAFGNVPLNERLATMDAESSETSAFWRRYVVVWTRWNHLRTVASAGSILLYAMVGVP